MKRLKLGSAIGLAAMALSLTMAPMAGAVNYPPSTTTPTTTPQTVTFTNSSPGNPIVVTVGANSTVTLGGYNPGTTCTVTIQPGGQTVQVAADANGFCTLVINFLGPHIISINGSAPITVPFGAISISVSGTGPTGAPVTQTGYFNNLAAASSSGGLAFTGAEIGALAIGALVLVSAGMLLVLSTRRRTRTTKS